MLGCSFASDPEIATLSPQQTMENMRRKLLPIANKIFTEMRRYNRVIKSLPVLKFKPINLMSMGLFYSGLVDLYQSGNLSRTDYAEAFGYDWLDQQEKRSDEQQVIEEMEVPEFAPVPHSNEPGRGGSPSQEG